jgi:hypothetical protein
MLGTEEIDDASESNQSIDRLIEFRNAQAYPRDSTTRRVRLVRVCGSELTGAFKGWMEWA